VLVSGGGSNNRAIYEAAVSGRVNVGVVRHKPGDDDACDCLLRLPALWVVGQ
jgi:hypothetical protein